MSGEMIRFDGGKHGDDTTPWERWKDESPQAFSAFTLYLQLGSGRSVVAVAQECNKSLSLLNRWSSRWRWSDRAQAYDRYEARIISERTLARLAKLRVRELQLIDSIDTKALKKLDSMSDAEIRELSPMELAAWIRVSSELKQRSWTTSEGETVSFPVALQPPTFVTQHIHCPDPTTHATVQVPSADARNGMQPGWIPRDRLEEARRDIPGLVVIC